MKKILLVVMVFLGSGVARADDTRQERWRQVAFHITQIWVLNKMETDVIRLAGIGKGLVGVPSQAPDLSSFEERVRARAVAIRELLCELQPDCSPCPRETVGEWLRRIQRHMPEGIMEAVIEEENAHRRGLFGGCFCTVS